MLQRRLLAGRRIAVGLFTSFENRKRTESSARSVAVVRALRSGRGGIECGRRNAGANEHDAIRLTATVLKVVRRGMLDPQGFTRSDADKLNSLAERVLTGDGEAQPT